MGLFDFFSSPPTLEGTYKDALSRLFTVENVGERQYNEGVNKLARAQARLKETLNQDEILILITPNFNAVHEPKYYTYEGLGIITSKRVIQFKKEIERETFFDDIAEIEGRIHPSGYFAIDIIKNVALPYKGFWGKPGEYTQAAHKYFMNTLMLNFPTLQLKDEFVNTIPHARKAVEKLE